MQRSDLLIFMARGNFVRVLQRFLRFDRQFSNRSMMECSNFENQCFKKGLAWRQPHATAMLQAGE